MALVTVTNPESCRDLTSPDRPLKRLLITEAGMDGTDAETAIRRLTKGKRVDISFEEGDERAANEFAKRVQSFGLVAELHEDEPVSWFGSPPRPIFLKLSIAVLFGFAICAWMYSNQQNAPTTRAAEILELLLIISWLYSGSGGLLDRRPQSEAEKSRHQTLSFWWKMGMLGAMILVATIAAEPMYGVVLLALALGGFACTLLIRWINHN